MTSEANGMNTNLTEKNGFNKIRELLKNILLRVSHIILKSYSPDIIKVQLYYHPLASAKTSGREYDSHVR